MQKSLKSRNEIMTVAEKLFCSFGFEKTSVDQIAKEANKAKGSVYYHFANKEDIIRSVINREIDKLKENLLLVIVDENLPESEKLKKYILKRMNFMNDSFLSHKKLKDTLCKNVDKYIIDLYTDLKQNFYVWEREQLTAIIVSGKNKNIFDQKLEVTKFVNMLSLVITNLETPFFIYGEYESHQESFEYMIDTFMSKIFN